MKNAKRKVFFTKHRIDKLCKEALIDKLRDILSHDERIVFVMSLARSLLKKVLEIYIIDVAIFTSERTDFPLEVDLS